MGHRSGGDTSVVGGPANHGEAVRTGSQTEAMLLCSDSPAMADNPSSRGATDAQPSAVYHRQS